MRNFQSSLKVLQSDVRPPFHGFSFQMTSSRLRSSPRRMSGRLRTRSKTSDHLRHQQNHLDDISRITILDDDDDVQILTQPSVSQVSSSSNATHSEHDADLELRLGRSGTGLARSSQRAVGGTHSSKTHKTATIDLTSGNDDEVIILTSRKRKAIQISPETSKDVQLSCAICMDIMKEETSTVCGHIFCRQCILRAIQTQKKCPTCRRKLSNINIHRIYLPKNTR